MVTVVNTRLPPANFEFSEQTLPAARVVEDHINMLRVVLAMRRNNIGSSMTFPCVPVFRNAPLYQSQISRLAWLKIVSAASIWPTEKPRSARLEANDEPRIQPGYLSIYRP